MIQESNLIINKDSKSIQFNLDNELFDKGQLIEIPMLEVINPNQQPISFNVFAKVDSKRKLLGNYTLFPSTEPFNYIIDMGKYNFEKTDALEIIIESTKDLNEGVHIKFSYPKEYK